MPEYVAFLRGINVGGHRVKMERLRELFEELDLTQVSSFIASGNVLFSTESEDIASLSDKIERHLARKLGYEVATFLRSSAQVAAMAEPDPIDERIGDQPTSSVYVILLKAPASKEVREGLANLSSEMDAFRFSQTEIYWRLRGKLSESPLFSKGLDGALLGEPTTTRNMNTLRRLVMKIG